MPLQLEQLIGTMILSYSAVTEMLLSSRSYHTMVIAICYIFVSDMTK